MTAVLTAAALTAAAAAPASAAYIETEREAWSEFSDFYGKEWDKERNAYLGKKAGAVNITLKIGDAVRGLAGTFTGGEMDFSWLDSIGLEAAASAAEEGVFNVAFGVLLNDTVLATAEMPIDFEKNAIAFRVPQISRDYLGIPFEFENEESLRQWEHLKDVMSPEFLAAHMPDGQTAAALLKRYGDIVLNGMTEEEAGEETVNVCGVEQNFTVYEGRISEKGVYQVAETMLQTAQYDPQFKMMIENLGEFSSQPALYEEYQKAVEEQLAELQEEQEQMEVNEDNYISSKIWMDEDGERAGREITIYESGEKMAQISWLGTEKDGNAGFRLLYDDGGRDTYLFSGNGVIADGMLDGSYGLQINGERVLAVDVTDFDVNLENGDIDGTYEFSYVGETEDMFLTSFSLLADVEEKAAEQTSRLELSLMMEDEMFAALNIRTGMETDLLDGRGTDGVLYRADDQEDVQAYVSGLDAAAILEKCKEAGVPDDFLEQVTELVMELMMQTQPDASDPEAELSD